MLAALEAAIASLQILGAPDMPQQARRPAGPCCILRVQDLVRLRDRHLHRACRMEPRLTCLMHKQDCVACWS